MSEGVLRVDVDPSLRPLLPARRRRSQLAAAVDPTATLGHVVTSLGVPLTEVGGLVLDGVGVASGRRADVAGRLEVHPVARPQSCPTDPPRYLLDVHLGSLARRLRLLGLDAAYRNDASDPWLVDRANRERRVLLTRDRGLLCRRNLAQGAYVRGDSAEEQLDDVLDRFAPTLAPWTRCTACGGLLEDVPAPAVTDLLEPGTRSTYTDFSRCTRCGRPYWRGAHAARLEATVRRAEEVVARRRPGDVGPRAR